MYNTLAFNHKGIYIYILFVHCVAILDQKIGSERLDFFRYKGKQK